MKTGLSHPKYRPDIDGLRAIAVLAVVIFHAAPSRMPGGFLGVDIFFVISGFLISTIIFENLEHKRFSFLEFYSRRIRRIFPALLLVLISVFAVGWFSLLADEFAELGKHIMGGAGFVANILFWRESGYFDTASHTKPLLHLWSLGIEEQFYIVWPLLLWFAWKRRQHVFLLIIGLAVLSFALNMWEMQDDAAAAFYLPQTRFWELLAGAILAYIRLYPQNLFVGLRAKIDSAARRVFSGKSPASAGAAAAVSLLHNVQSFTGAVLLVASLMTINQEMPFPGWRALVPVTGAVCIIAAGPQAWFNRRVLSHRLLVWFGLISYPLYLWHWPLLSFARIIHCETPSRWIRITIVCLSVLLAWLTYKFIERPLRFGGRRKGKTIVLVLIMCVVAFLGVFISTQDGMPLRRVVQTNPNKGTGWDGGISEKLITRECGITSLEDKALFAFCVQDVRQLPRFALLGDSKAASLYQGLIRTSGKDGRWLFIGGNGANGAPVPLLSESIVYKDYQKLARMAVKAIAENPSIETVVLVTAARAIFHLKPRLLLEDLPEKGTKLYPLAVEALRATTDKLIAAGKKVVLVVDNPTLPDPRDCLGRKTALPFLNDILAQKTNQQCHLPLDKHIALSKIYRELLQEVASGSPEAIKIFDTTKYMCDLERGVCDPYKDGRLLYSYSDHISDYAGGLIGKDLNVFLIDHVAP